MFLVDSNIIVYSYLPEYIYLRDLLVNESVLVSEITRVEVLGYHKLNPDEENYFRKVFDFVPAILPSQQIFDSAIELRQKYNLKLGDSIIGATALISDLPLYSRNLKDFDKIPQVKCINPVR